MRLTLTDIRIEIMLFLKHLLIALTDWKYYILQKRFNWCLLKTQYWLSKLSSSVNWTSYEW